MERPITIDNLKASGWNVTGDGAYPAEKVISRRGHDDEEKITLVVHRLYNSEQLALVIPDGHMINITAKDMDELETFERMIDSVDMNY